MSKHQEAREKLSAATRQLEESGCSCYLRGFRQGEQNTEPVLEVIYPEGTDPLSLQNLAVVFRCDNNGREERHYVYDPAPSS